MHGYSTTSFFLEYNIICLINMSSTFCSTLHILSIYHMFVRTTTKIPTQPQHEHNTHFSIYVIFLSLQCGKRESWFRRKPPGNKPHAVFTQIHTCMYTRRGKRMRTRTTTTTKWNKLGKSASYANAIIHSGILSFSLLPVTFFLEVKGRGESYHLSNENGTRHWINERISFGRDCRLSA